MTQDFKELEGLNSEQLSRNAGYLVQFFRHSFKTRAQNLLKGGFVFDTPTNVEMINYILWNGGFGVITAAELALTLNSAIYDDAKKMKEIVAEARERGHTPKMLSDITKLQIQIEAAEELIDLLEQDNG